MRMAKALRVVIVIAALECVTHNPLAVVGAPFDFIYISEVTANFCSGCGITSVTYGFGLVVNTGTTDFVGEDLRAATVEAKSSVPGFEMGVFVSNLPNSAPIKPGEAVGSVVPSINGALLSQIRAGELFRNTTPSQVLAIHINRDLGNSYVGDVIFDWELRFAGETARFQTRAHMGVGPDHEVRFLAASRVRSVGSTCSTPTVVPIVQQAYLKASNIHADDQFGTSVAISGDTLVVGAPLEDGSAATDSGAAYVFVRSGTSWSQQAYLKASNPGAGDKFGSSVAIYGNTVVVGAPGEASSATGVGGNQNNNSALNSGAAYVFVRSGTSWNQQAYLKASNTGADDQFGFSVAVSSNTVVIGAPGEDSNGTQSDNSAPAAGAAYVFVRNGTTWSQQAYLKASNRESNDEFGTSAAVSENTVVVGAPGEDSNATGVEGNQASNSALGAGAAYVFVRNGTTWSQQAYLKASNTEAADRFGERVQVSWDTIVVGATGEDSNATGVNGNQSNNSAPESGAAYVFVRNVTSWTQQAYLKGCNTEANDFFGRSVGVSADTVVVGAHLEDSGATGVNGNASDNGTADSGAAYVFVRSGTSWAQQAYLKASNTGAGDNFGYSVGVSAESLVVGAIGEASSDGRQNDNGALKSGAAYVFGNLGLSPPELRLDKSGNMATICWPRPGTGFVLMQTPSLTSPVWTQVPPPYVTNATEICVTLTVPSGVDARFFRLCQCLP